MKALLILQNGATQKVDVELPPFRKRWVFLEELEAIKEEIKKSYNKSGLINKVVRVHLYRN